MIKLEFNVGGRSVSPEKFAESLIEDAAKAAMDELARRARRMADPVSGALPIVRVKRRSDGDYELELSGVTAEHIEHIKQRLTRK